MIKKIKLLLTLLIKLIFTLKECGWPKFRKKSEYLIFTPDFFSLYFFSSDNFQRAFATYKALKGKGLDVAFYTTKDIGKVTNRKIFIFPSSRLNEFSFINYASHIHFLITELESQGNIVFPRLNEMKYWENKIFMHKEFERLGIHSPNTQIVNEEGLYSLLDKDAFKPFLIKEPHSCSGKGVFQVLNKSSLGEIVSSIDIRLKFYLKQDLLNIKRDLRVILVDDEIIWHYWRINTSNEWKPTSTGNGGEVDFDFFPENWRIWILSEFKKLNMVTGAFDIAWENDDLSTEPFILEVSPFYQPNPKPAKTKNKKYYGRWKNSIRLSDNYQIAFVKLIITIQIKIVNSYLSQCDK
jgi:glutathione synthase/RimK-type ligase-like ATP-grasp enzyme